MTIKPIRNDDDLKAVFRRLESIFQAEEQTPEADERDVLVTLVEAYENKHYDFVPGRPRRGHQVPDGAAGSDRARPRAFHRTERPGLRSAQPQAASEPAHGQAAA